MKPEVYLNKLKRLLSLADAGLVYSPNPYDLERFEEMKEICLEMLADDKEIPDDLRALFPKREFYPTPQVDIRGMVLDEEKHILLVKESADNRWALPGGWGDIGFAPSEVIVKEIKEETGLDAKAERLLAVFDKRCHPHPPQPFYVYKFLFHCTVVKGEINQSHDIMDVGFFPIDNLPEISVDRILPSQIELGYHKIMEDDLTIYCD